MSQPPIESTTIVPRRVAHHLVPVAPVSTPADRDGLEVFQLLTILRQNKRYIFRVATFTFGIVLIATLLSSMQFESTARVYLGELEKQNWSPSHASDDLDLSGGHGDTATEIEILDSRTLVTRAILDSGLNVAIKPPGWSPPRYWRWLSSWRSPSLLEGATKEIGAVETSLSDKSIASKSYDVHFTTNLDYEVRAHPPSWPWHAPANETPGHGRMGEPLKFHELTLTLVPGTERGPSAGARYTLDVQSLADVYASAKKGLDVSTPVTKVPIPGDTVKVADLTFTARSPELAAKFLDCLMRGYLEERHSWETENATAAEAFVTTQLATIRGNLDDVQKKLADYRATHSVVVLDDEAKALVEEIGRFEQQRFDTRIELETLGAVDVALKRPNAPLEAYMFSEVNDPVLTSLATSLSQSQQKLAEADSRFNSAAPDVRE
ncbi:MAG TPA: Wzz/FepE/Etk N-terminal domain-containing protein, partial [Polyangiaceae bacterium]|nr:Wzz/FepE/Etk N-terminal domain-containing protein [Polyangiaceae bacterium]